MVAGRPVTNADINGTAAQLAASVFTVMQNVQHFKAWLDGFTAQNLVDNYGFTLADANVLKSAFTDLGDLAGIFNNTAAVASLPHDYRVFARQLLGTGLY